MALDHSYLDLKQFSELSGLSPSTVRRRVRDGSLSAFQPGGRGKKLLFAPNALDPCKTPGSPDPAPEERSAKPLPGRRPGWTKSFPK
jgi:hypothetical protein